MCRSNSIAVDKWIDNAKHHVCPPTGNALVPYQSLDYLLWQDKVECILHVKENKVLAEGLLDNLGNFTLNLCLRVPPSSGFLMYYRHSPMVVIDTYTGGEEDVHAPEWLRANRPERKFWQQRTLMLDLILYFVANLPENAGLSSKVKAWCKTVSVPASGMITSNIRHVKHVSPYNTRSSQKKLMSGGVRKINQDEGSHLDR